MHVLAIRLPPALKWRGPHACVPNSPLCGCDRGEVGSRIQRLYRGPYLIFCLSPPTNLNPVMNMQKCKCHIQSFKYINIVFIDTKDMHDILWYIAFITYEFLCAVPTPSKMWHAQNDIHYVPIEVIKNTIVLFPY